ncbi:hypothetical protein Rhal01_03479 [Rubritalea halochordaticola]|uniref:GntR family transcriptional regulator n=1 Tax=Rubritalea halochordaticola TaxID=714537 RepID=A0ABP9V899_9BACT
MAPLPPRDSRVLQTVEILQQDICSGTLQGDLPGERELARRLRVGRVTLRSALEVLEKAQWVTAAVPGKRRRTLKTPRASTQQYALQPNHCEGKVIVTLSPQDLQDLPTYERLNYTRLISLCSSAGITSLHRQLDLSQVKRPSHRLKEFIKQNPADLYLLLLSDAETQKWFDQQQLPCLVLGSTWPDVSLSCVDYDQRAIGLHVASTLNRLHHRHAAMLYTVPEKRGLQLFVDGFQAAGTDCRLTLARHDDSPDSVRKALETLARSEQRPSAIILPRIPYVNMATSLLPSLGLQIPRDISLLCLVYDETLRYSHPPVAGYQLSTDLFPKAIFQLVVKKLLHPEVSRTEVSLVVPDFTAAASLAPLQDS